MKNGRCELVRTGRISLEFKINQGVLYFGGRV